MTLENLVNGQLYQFQVMATNAVGISPWSGAVSGIPTAVSIPILLAPPTPARLQAEARPGRVILTWYPVRTATDYDVRYRTAVEWTTVAHTVITDPTVEVAGLLNGQAYEFEVRATNIWGRSRWSDSVRVTPRELAPLTPTGLLTLAGNGRVGMTWNAVSDATNYDYRYRPVTERTWTEVTAGTNLTRAIFIGDLLNNLEYQFSVRASNAAGTSPWSDEVRVTPRAGATPAPAGLAASRGNERVTLSWEAVADAIDYDWRWRLTNAAGLAWTTESLGGDTELTAVIDELTNGAEYEFQVRADRGETNGGFSPWSNSVTATPQVTAPENAPANLRATSGEQRVSLEWDEVAGATDYDYRHRLAGSSDDWTSVTETVIAGQRATVSDLTNGEEYEFQVRAGNAGGYSAWTDSVRATPEAVLRVPAVPAGLGATPGDQEVLLGWTASPTATDYDWRYRLESPADSPWVQHTGESPPDTSTSVRISGLTNGRAYHFQVRAGNADGESAWSESIGATPRVPLPAIPANVMARRGYELIELSWDAALNAIDYDYRYRIGLEDWTVVDSTSIGGTSVVQDGLVNGTRYELQVRAVNSTGDSAWSASAFATPLARPAVPSGLALTEGDRQINASWAAAALADAYEYRVRPDGQNWSEPVRIMMTGVTLFELLNGTSYEFEVRAVNASGESDWSETETATPIAPPATPAGLRGTPRDSAVLLNWNAADRAADYDYRYTLGNTPWTEVTNTQITGTSVVVPDLVNGVEYRFGVRARNAGGESPWSNDITVIPAIPPDPPDLPDTSAGRARRWRDHAELGPGRARPSITTTATG